MAALLGFDIGNTRIKLARRDPAGITNLGAWPHDSWPQSWPTRGDEAAVICSVRPAATQQLIQQLTEQAIPIDTITTSDGGVFRAGLLQVGIEAPEVTGVDRLLAAAAARKYSPDSAVITVDAGSAVTVDLTTNDGVFQGGAILPGLRLMADSLTQRTAALPPVEFTDPPPTMPGRATIPAIRAGVQIGLAGAIDRLIGELDPNRAATVYLAGGDSARLAPLLRTSVNLTPMLVLEGLFLYADAVKGAA